MKKFGSFLKKHKKFFISAIAIVVVIAAIAISLDLKEKHKWKKHPVAEYHYDFVDNEDIETLRSRILATKLDAELDVTKVLEDFDAETSTFKSIDYDSDTKADWYPLNHLKYIAQLQIAYYSEGNAHYQDPAVKEVVVKALNNWAEEEYHCEWNWWYNDVGVGKYLPDILLFGVDGLDEATQTKLLKNVKNTLLPNEKVFNGAVSRAVDSSGGNLTDQALSTMKVAVIEKDGSTLMWIKNLLERELHPFPDYKKSLFRADCVGIKSDGSFQQHDQLIYFGGYGEVFADGLNSYLGFTKDTQYALNNEAINLYADFLLDGMQLFTRGGYRDISASGRGIARRDGLKGIASQTKKGAEILLTYKDIARADELKSMLDNRFLSETDGGANAHKYFYESDFQVINNPNYMATVRAASNRTRIYEFLNGENPFAYYTGMGATFYSVHGDEYYNILPLYDWNKIPGTTTRQGLLPYHDEGFSYNQYGYTDHINGVSNGKLGMSYMELKDNAVKGKKAYFMFEDAMVCLGNSLTTSKKEALLTNINQANLQGDVILVGNNAQTALNLGEVKTGKYEYIYHNNIAYFTDAEVEVGAEHIEGDWKTLNERANKSTPIEGDRFTLSIPHSEKKNAFYAYTVLMNTTEDGAKAYADAPRYEVIQNDKNIQAVFDTKTGILQAVFHKAGELKYADGKTVKVNKPCVILVEPTDNGSDVTFASYTNGPKQIKAKLTMNGTEQKIVLQKKSTAVHFA